MGQAFALPFKALNGARICCRAMPEVSPADAKQLIDAGAQLVDVRTETEYAAGHIPGSRHVPLDGVQAEAANLDQGKPVIVYCRSGERSGPAADAFTASGWDSHSIEGGLLAWAEGGLPLDPEDGTVAENPNMPPR
jgi:rhodanese-related sulfurtransferase